MLYVIEHVLYVAETRTVVKKLKPTITFSAAVLYKYHESFTLMQQLTVIACLFVTIFAKVLIP